MSDTLDASPFLSKGGEITARYIRQVEGQGTFGNVRTKAMRTGDHMVLLEIEYPPEAGAPLHVHQHETICYVVSGKVRVTVGDDEFVMEAGDACTHPLGVPHGIRGIEHAVVLEVKSPAQKISEFLHISDT
ncbi:MAG TPA: cupin domain-containing protein [Actinomycetota bacterium]|nr:cupin domain-containing protein [Actinomycetota bacterium]